MQHIRNILCKLFIILFAFRNTNVLQSFNESKYHVFEIVCRIQTHNSIPVIPCSVVFLKTFIDILKTAIYCCDTLKGRIESDIAISTTGISRRRRRRRFGARNDIHSGRARSTTPPPGETI